MRYLGGKTLIVEHILDVMKREACSVDVFADFFAGSGVVARKMKSEGCSVIANDILFFSYVLAKGTLCNNSLSPRVMHLMEQLNSMSLSDTSYSLEDCFLYKNYSPNASCTRMYFQNDNAIKIDIIRQTIEQLKGELEEREYYYLLASLVSAVPFISNITGTYAAYLKFWDKRTFKKLMLGELPLVCSSAYCDAYNEDAISLAGRITADLAYIDPPYNERDYLSNYHILETLAKYDRPTIKGVTGMRSGDGKKSDFCSKRNVRNAFYSLLSSLKCRYIIISYNNEGLLSTEELANIVKDCGIRRTFKLYEFDYRRYKSKIPNNQGGLKEQLYFIEKGRNV